MAEHKCIWLYLFPSGLPFITKSRFISPPPPSRPVLSSSSLRPHLKSKTPPLRAKIFFLPPPDLFFLVLTSAIRVVRPPNFPRFISTTFKPVAAVLSDATLFEITNNIAIHLLDSNN
ncbi:hypothetical protein FVER53590_29624 [Fusarium verticillioides]|nr:hypothetical protein FVER53590_29624 [Fusarium verticillioides]